MPSEKQRITVLLTQTEHNFILWCRKQEFVEFRLQVKDGEPTKAFEPIRTYRFDIGKDD